MIAKVTMIGVLLFSVVIAAQGPDKVRADAQIRRVDDRMRALQAEADALAAQA